MKNFKLEINARIDIEKDENNYKSVIQDIKEDSFHISVPVNNGEYLTFNNNEFIELFYYKDQNYIYKLSCRVIGTAKDNNIPLYKISLPMEIVKIQRRNFVRVEISQKAKYSKVGIESEQMLPALLLDLSGGGVRIKVKEKLNYGDLINVEVSCSQQKLCVKGKIVRVEKGIDGRDIYGASFFEIDNNTREKIIQQVFAIMRKQRELV